MAHLIVKLFTSNHPYFPLRIMVHSYDPPGAEVAVSTCCGRRRKRNGFAASRMTSVFETSYTRRWNGSLRRWWHDLVHRIQPVCCRPDSAMPPGVRIRVASKVT